MTVTSLSYLFIESVEGKQYKVVAKAWVGSALLTMVGAAMQPTSFGGQGWTTGVFVSRQFLPPAHRRRAGIARAFEAGGGTHDA